MRRCLLFHQRMLTWNLSLLVLGLSLPCLLSLSLAQAPPITPSGLNTQVSEPIAVGGQTQYDITGGTRPGGGANLFHSFGDFGVPTNSIANFQNTPVNGELPATSNILARVTGGDMSNIFGSIKTADFGSANLFLMNPAGFLFGPNATVNVNGMVAFTSANYLRMGELGSSDAGIFHADLAQASILTNAPVAAFGFLGSNPGAIIVQGSQFTAKSISLVGGNSTIESGTPDGGTAQSAQFSAPNGKIQLAIAASPGEFAAATLQPLPNVDDALFSSFGSVTLAPDSSMNVSGINTVSIRGGEFVLSIKDAVLSTAVTPATTETVMLGNGSAILASTQGSSSPGDIDVTAKTVQLNGALINASTNGPAPGGSITLRGNQKISLIDSSVGTNAQSFELDGGNAGRIQFVSPVIDLQGSVLTSSTLGGGRAGAIILEGASINLGASPFSMPFDVGTDVLAHTEGTGSGGNIIIRGFQGEGSRADSVALSGFTQVLTETIGTFGNEGDAGKITIDAAHLSISDSTRVGSESRSSAGDAGSIHLTVDEVTVSQSLISTSTDGFGNAGAVTIQGLASPALSVHIDGSGSGIFTDTEGTGAGGSIFVNANSVTLQNGGTLSVATSGTAPTARGGTITVEGNRVQLNSAATITAATSGPANAGEVLVRSDTFSINEGATISAQSTGSGNAGNVTIQGHASPADSAVISGFDENFNPSGIFTDTQATGAGGNIHISAKSIALQDSGTLSATTSGTASTATGGAIMIDAETLSMDGATITAETGADNTGRAGNVTISAKTIETANFSFITTVSKGIGQAGDISLKATDRISLIDSFVNSDTFPSLTSTKAGDGGLIHLHAPMIDLQSTLLGAVTTGAGNAGNLLLEAQQLNIQASEFGKPFNTGSELKAQTQSSGNAGAITIRGLGGEGSSADIVTLTDASRLSSRTSDTGDAGNISIAAAQLTLSEGANLSSSTESGIGTGGSINLFAESFTIQTGGTLLATTSGTDTTATGGSITVKATDQVIMTSGASITANSTGPGDAGDISIKAGQQFEMRDSSITTTATKASGGNIDIQAVNRVYLVNSPISASVADGRGGGGNISIDPQFVILQNSQILAKAADGQGGAITITTNLFLPDANSIVNADANPGSGVNGTVTIQSPNAPASGHIQPLDKSPLQATSLLNQRCAALAGGEFSSFTVAGRDSLPTEPGSWLASPLAIGLTKTGDTLTEKGGGHAGINDITDEPAQLSLRQIAPAGFLTQVFAVDLSAGCTS
jgi:filamentous hemagglutinin family protein